MTTFTNLEEIKETKTIETYYPIKTENELPPNEISERLNDKNEVSEFAEFMKALGLNPEAVIKLSDVKEETYEETKYTEEEIKSAI